MKHLDRWFAADADVTRWEFAAGYLLVLAVVAGATSLTLALVLLAFSAVLVLFGVTRWDDEDGAFLCDDPNCRVCHWGME